MLKTCQQLTCNHDFSINRPHFHSDSHLLLRQWQGWIHAICPWRNRLVMKKGWSPKLQPTVDYAFLLNRLEEKKTKQETSKQMVETWATMNRKRQIPKDHEGERQQPLGFTHLVSLHLDDSKYLLILGLQSQILSSTSCVLHATAPRSSNKANSAAMSLRFLLLKGTSSTKDGKKAKSTQGVRHRRPLELGNLYISQSSSPWSIHHSLIPRINPPIFQALKPSKKPNQQPPNHHFAKKIRHPAPLVWWMQTPGKSHWYAQSTFDLRSL